MLFRLVGAGASLEEAVAAPRLHTEGGLDVTAEAARPAEELEHLRKAGYEVRTGAAAVVHAVRFDPGSGAVKAASR